ncbi:MAG: DNA-binding protein [Cytophagales bacterium]|nr:MAG: DNA-binding protein [Cytophagales bacterium]
MTDFVIDANILMSILISGKASYKPLLTYYNFILPDFVLVEVEKYKHILKMKTKMQDDEFLQWTYFVFSQITILPQYALSEESLEKSKKLLDKIDLKDATYVALAMQLDLLLLTRDNPLHEGLRKQGFRKVMLFEDFLRTL